MLYTLYISLYMHILGFEAFVHVYVFSGNSGADTYDVQALNLSVSVSHLV